MTPEPSGGAKALSDPTGSDNASLPIEFAHVLLGEAVSTSPDHALFVGSAAASPVMKAAITARTTSLTGRIPSDG
jgi:hypothetical protein